MIASKKIKKSPSLYKLRDSLCDPEVESYQEWDRCPCRYIDSDPALRVSGTVEPISNLSV